MRSELATIVSNHREQLQALEQKRQAALSDIHSRTKSPVKPTPEARERVNRALDRGMSYRDLVAQLVRDGDRAGLAALRAEVPYMGKLLPGDMSDPIGYVDMHDQQLMTDAERRALAEQRSVEANTGLQDCNSREIDKWLNWQTLGNAAASQTLGGTMGISPWYDLPGQNTQSAESEE